MIGFLTNLFTRAEPSVSEARTSDAAELAALHGTSFNRGWSEDEFERLLMDRAVLVHRTMIGRRLVGFVVSRIIAGEAEILSVAVASSRRRKGLAKQMLNLHLRRLAGLGARTVFLEVDESNVPANRLYQRFGFRAVGRREGYYPYPDQLGRNRGSNFPGQTGKSAAALVLRCDFP
ncbi:MAG TPA: GNAT family N-acetyltransferase [Xanthobacteraceae bacterium]